MAGVAFWCAVWLGVLSLLRLLPGTAGVLSAVLQAVAGGVLVVVGVPLLLRFVRSHLLWSLRNKLVLTYLLVGLAPVVLLVTLVSVCAYIAAGQFAIHLAEIHLQSRLDELNGWNWLAWETLDRETGGHLLDRVSQGTPLRWEPTLESRDQTMQSRLGAFIGGVPVTIMEAPAQGQTPLGLPPWATQLSDNEMHGIVLDAEHLFLVVVRQRSLPDGRRFSLVSSVPVDREMMQSIAQDLGRAGLFGVPTDEPASSLPSSQKATKEQRGTARPNGLGVNPMQGRSSEELQRRMVFGGAEPVKASLLDLQVRFLSTLPAVDWDSGRKNDVPIEVDSRPSRLYEQLFGSSVTGIVTRVLRISLLVLCVLFAIIEALALWMAMRLSHTVTASVTELYAATQRVDRGDLQHTIAVEREDQMAELSRSFNRMTGSLQRLLEEQKEKQRLQNELSIAQEVQANLFPHAIIHLPTLELHGICRPARAVSGDYYDFLLFGNEDPSLGASTADGARPRGGARLEGGLAGVATGVGIAVGDISGKGISAALLMATLHSAVRAYQLAAEELLLTAKHAMAGASVPQSAVELFESPGTILSLLNRHLYRSTQPEKYATLFLAHYDAETARLTYSNAGQLPPLILRADGSICRLDVGGTVVGLMDGMRYEQESINLRTGDILVAYSDGVTEPENDFGDFGEERLMDVVRRYRDQPLHLISTQVMQALSAWIGAEEQPDDITLVLARQI